MSNNAASPAAAIRTGLTGRAILLPSEDAAAYETHVARYAAEFQPSGLRETELVQSLADTSWRLQRIPCLEAAIYARGRMEFASTVSAQAAEHRPALLDLETHLRYEKPLRNLQIQEGRLSRRYDKEMKELRQLQADRKAAAAKAESNKTAPARPAGFVFSTPAQDSTFGAPSEAIGPVSEAIGVLAQPANRPQQR
jgi:hypothetical protein